MFALLALATPAKSQTTPRIVVNIVVGTMQAEDLERYASNFSIGGFKRLMNDGAWFSNASYDYMQTTTPVSLATISTGALPSTHGVVADSWFDYIGNKRISLINDSKEQSLNYNGSQGYSPRNLIAETLSEALAEHSDKSRIATVAIDPSSAIITAGRAGEVYWLEDLRTSWTTSTFYAKELPSWISLYNRNDCNESYMIKRWELLLPYDDYINSQVSCVEGLTSKNDKRIILIGDEQSVKSGAVLSTVDRNRLLVAVIADTVCRIFFGHVYALDTNGICFRHRDKAGALVALSGAFPTAGHG
jgi:hypothetical protein